MILIIAQTGFEQAMQSAANNGGWTAVLVVCVMAACVLSMGFVGRWFIRNFDERLKEANAREEAISAQACKREERLAARITELENFIRNSLVGMISDCSTALHHNTSAFESLMNTLDRRPCLLEKKP